MYYVYVLQSIRGNHFYIGVTLSLLQRLNKHNNGSSKSTKPYRPWQIIYTESYKTKSEAMKREYYLKSPRGYLEKKKIIENNKE